MTLASDIHLLATSLHGIQQALAWIAFVLTAMLLFKNMGGK